MAAGELPYTTLSSRGKIFAEHTIDVNKFIYVHPVDGGVRLGIIYPNSKLSGYKETSFVLKDSLLDWLILQLVVLRQQKKG